MNDKMSREERLGRRLLRAMGLHVDPDLIIRSRDYGRLHYEILDWRGFHFGDVFRNSFIDTVHFISKHFAEGRINIPVQKYSSLDELDIQLTLIGENYD